MEDQVIVTTSVQLQSMIGEAVGAIIPKLAEFRRKNEAVETDGMTVEQAAQFLTEQGISTTCVLSVKRYKAVREYESLQKTKKRLKIFSIVFVICGS